MLQGQSRVPHIKALYNSLGNIAEKMIIKREKLNEYLGSSSKIRHGVQGEAAGQQGRFSTFPICKTLLWKQRASVSSKEKWRIDVFKAF